MHFISKSTSAVLFGVAVGWGAWDATQATLPVSPLLLAVTLFFAVTSTFLGFMPSRELTDDDLELVRLLSRSAWVMLLFAGVGWFVFAEPIPSVRALMTGIILSISLLMAAGGAIGYGWLIRGQIGPDKRNHRLEW